MPTIIPSSMKLLIQGLFFFHSFSFASDPALTTLAIALSDTSKTATIFNTANPTQYKTITLPYGANAVGIDPTGTQAYISLFGTSTLQPLHITDGSLGSSVNVGSYPYGVVYNSQGNTVYTANDMNNTVSVINTVNGTTTAITVGSHPQSLVLNSDGTLLYVANTTDKTINVIDTTTNTVMKTYSVGVLPKNITLSPEGTKLYSVSSSSSTVTIINLTNDTITTFSAGAAGYSVAISPEGTKLYIAQRNSNRVRVYNTADNTLLQTVSVSSANGLSLTPDGTTLFVTSYGSDTLTAINTATYTTTSYAINTAGSNNLSPFISPSLLTGTLNVSSQNDLSVQGITHFMNFAGGTLKTTANTDLNNPIYLHNPWVLTFDNATSLQTTSGGTIDTNGYTLTLSSALSGNGNLIKTGEGELKLTAQGSSIGTLHIQQGQVTLQYPLTTTGLTLTNTSSLKLLLYPDSQGGKLIVNGNAVLNGNLLLSPQNGSWQRNTVYTLINATNISGEFLSVSVDSPFLTPYLTYSPTALSLLLRRNDLSYTAYADTQAGKSVAAALDTLPPSSLINTIDTQPINSLPSLFTTLYPATHYAIHQTFLASSFQLSDTLFSRLTFPPSLIASSKPLASLNNNIENCIPQNRIWGNIVYGRHVAKEQKNNAFNKTTSHTTALNGGIEDLWQTKGLAWSLSQTDTHSLFTTSYVNSAHFLTFLQQKEFLTYVQFSYFSTQTERLINNENAKSRFSTSMLSLDSHYKAPLSTKIVALAGSTLNGVYQNSFEESTQYGVTVKPYHYLLPSLYWGFGLHSKASSLSYNFLFKYRRLLSSPPSLIATFDNATTPLYVKTPHAKGLYDTILRSEFAISRQIRLNCDLQTQKNTNYYAANFTTGLTFVF